ncbi:acetoacetate--CoA ligase [Arthrobacter sp. TS-15]|uniref:acetoacetate--CoA ligase n=1 Tax=Arthrobacter sp. TS-15 TaxID=2510797 RepID=UPI00115F05C0|nr:acetoacetate--CoA ligase [Arthrobacter sp. TS-15]TQS88281.1 acetoacetate--CoA ligase [Arthrobacter sp. TS-15]
MRSVETGTLLRAAPQREEWSGSRMGRFLADVEQKTGRTFASYEDAWQWSVDNLEEFWAEVWDHFEIISHTPYKAVLGDRKMPGAEWFPGATINYTEHIVRALRGRQHDNMVKSRSQTAGSSDWTGGRLLEEIGRIQQGLIRQGIVAGDRVAGYLPNIPQTLAAYLATTALGAIWCSVPPEMGPKSVVDRIAQLEPKLIIAIDGYRWGKKDLSRADDLVRIRMELPDTQVVLLPYLDKDCALPANTIAYADFTCENADIRFEAVPFSHPLTVLFSSGTTGKPKAIVHSHGGLLLEHFKAMGLHFDMGPKDTAFWFTTTGWMVWTLGISTLLTGAAVVLMDGDPNWPALDGEWSQWAVLAETEATYLGTGSAYLAACAHAGLTPGKTWDLSRLREIQCSGSPLAADVAGWVYDAVSPNLVLAPTSGGTDICAAFLGASPLTGVYAGEMSCRPLGVAVESWDPEGRPLHGAAGELVATQPMPSMPVFFWGDKDNERYINSYFGAYPGVWRHGDWLIETERKTWVISGRSDATLNRGGVRLGTAEFYAVLDGLPQVNDSMVLHFEDPAGGMGRLALLIEAQEGADTTQLEAAVRRALRTELSPRHVPDDIVFVPSIPRNPSGKRLEIPLKRVIQGAVMGDALDPGVLVKPDDVGETVRLIKKAFAA